MALAVALAGLAVWAARWVWKILMRTTQFLRDWEGEAAREGVAPRPGVMSRLQTVEHIVTDIHGQVYPNGGGSLRDVVHRTAADVAGIKDEQARVREDLARMEKQ